MTPLGPRIPLIIPFTLGTAAIIVIIMVIMVLWHKFCLYKGPEDEELWDEDNHFEAQGDDEVERARKG